MTRTQIQLPDPLYQRLKIIAKQQDWSLSAAKNNMVALPAQIFYSTQIPVCLWFCGKNNALDSANNPRLCDGEMELSLVV